MVGQENHLSYGLAEEGLRGFHAAIRAKQRSDGLPVLVDRAIQVVQPAPDGNRSLIHAPGGIHGRAKRSQRFSYSGT